MSYRKIEVDGTVFEYSVGRSHVKIKHVGAFPKHKVGHVIDEYEVRVRPGDIVAFIKFYGLKVKREDKRRKA
jgi:co-chaperonin GroES (HSP10)